VEIGALDRGDDALIVGPFEGLDRGDRLGADAGTVAESLVADDRRQPLVAAVALSQSRLSAPSAKQGVLGDVLSLARIIGVAIRDPETDSVRFPPLPAVAGVTALGCWSVDFSKVLKRKPNGQT